MLKFIIPAIIVFLIILFWESICEKIYNKFKIQLNYLVIGFIVLVIIIIIILLNN
jgi:hypothetical protein